MADNTPGGTNHDPLGDRLRATFEAEHTEVERRSLAASSASARSRSFRWIPFAAAAAVIAVAGFFFIGNRGPDDQAVDLDIAAAQPTPPDTPGQDTGSADPEPTESPEEPVASVGVFEPGANRCAAGEYEANRTVAWNAKGRPITPTRTPLTTPVADITRELRPGTFVDLAGGCVQVPTPTGDVTWYELTAPNGETDWVQAHQLVTPAQFTELTDASASPPAPVNGCGEPLIVAPFRFVWGIAADDPDGGLVAHTTIGIDAPVTRIIERDEIVVVTGRCELAANGSRWRELRAADGSLEWVSGRYLVEPLGGCLTDPSAPGSAPVPGLSVPDGDRIAFASDPLGRYQFYPAGRVIAGSTCGPFGGPDTSPCPVVGPVFVWGVAVDDPDGGLLTHTSADVDAPVVRTLRYDQADLVATGNCAESSSGSTWWQLAHAGGLDWASGNFLAHPTPACFVGNALADDSEEPFFHTLANGDSLGRLATIYEVPVEMILAANPDLDPNLMVEGQLVLIPGQDSTTPVPGWAVWEDDRVAFAAEGAASYRWFTAGAIVESCASSNGPGTSLANQPCSRVSTRGFDAAAISWTAGSTDSNADHVHEVYAETNDECTRIVVNFGANANENDEPANSVPALRIDFDLTTITITPRTQPWESAFGDTQRVDYANGGIGLLTLSPGYTFSLQLMHQAMEPHIRVLNDRPQLVIDLFPTDGRSGLPTAFGEQFVLRTPIQQDLTGPGISESDTVIVGGFGRPFEAQGLYRIWQVADDVDPDSFLANAPEPLVEGVFLTSGWAEAWGEFYVELPDLEPGSYIAVFGELPPTDEIGFYGAGQLFRVADPADPTDATYPEAALLPDVQLPPES